MRLRLIAVQVLLALLAVATAASAQPTLSKVFTPSTIGPGNVSTITFTITNGSASPVTSLAFTDVLPVLPGPMTIADPSNASTSCDLSAGGTLSAPDGGSTIALSDAQLGGSQSCTVTVDVTASTAGAHTNPAITLSSSAGSSMSLAIGLTVDTSLPEFSKSFAPSSIPLGDRSTLTFTIDNTFGALVGSLDFTDNLPTGMLVADPANASTDCVRSNTTLTATPGTSVIILDANGFAFAGFEVLPAGATCMVIVDVVGSGSGMLDNVTNDLLADFTSIGKASATLDVTVTPLALQKSFPDDPVPPGSAATLDFTIDNFDRNFSATAVAFTDDLTTLVPALAGLTFSSLLSNDCGGSVSGVGGTTIGLSGATLAPGGSCTLSVSLTVPAGATPGTYTNTTSTVTGTVDGSPVVGNMASDDLFVSPAPLLTKVFMGDPVNAGDTIVAEFTVTNTSTTSSATDVAFADFFDIVLPTASVTPGDGCCGVGSICTFTPLINPPPPGDTIPATLDISGGTLAPAGMAGDSCTFSITLDVATDTGPGIYGTATTDVTATVDGATRTGDPAFDTFTVIAAPELIKVFTDDPVAPGGTVTLEFTLTYPADATGDATDITFTDDLTALVPAIAGLTATGLPLMAACDPDGAGGNPGTGTLSGSMGDTLLTFMGGTLSPGESCTFSVTLAVPMGTAPGSYTNTTSSVGATVEGLAATAAAAADDLDVTGLVFTKEFLGDPVFAGDTVTLRFTIANIHPTDDATIILFTDSLTSALTGLAATGGPSVNTCGGTLSGTTSLTYSGGSVLSGLTCTVEVPVLVPAVAADGTYANTTSNLFADQGGVVIVDPAVDSLVVDSNRLQLTKAFTDDPVAPGDPVTLELVLTNIDATLAASGVGFTDDLGAALAGLTFDSVLLDTCGGTVGGTTTTMITVSGVSLAASASCTLRLSLTVPGGATAGGYTNTTSTVTGTMGGFMVSGDAASDDLEVIQLLTFSKSFGGPTTATGTATLTFTITNPGTDTATGIAFSDDLDAVITGLIATSLPAVPCGAGSSITGISFLTFTGGELAPMGAMCSFDVDVLVPAGVGVGTYPNTTSDLFQNGLLVSVPATADLIIEPPPVFSKSFAPTAIGVAGVATLTFTIDNTASAVAASALDFTDNLPAGTQVAATPNASTTCTGGTVTAMAGSGVISYTGGTVAAGGTCTVQADVTGTAVGAHVNTTGNLTSSSGTSGTATDTLNVGLQPTFAKVFAPDSILVGGVSTLTFTIDNTAGTLAASSLDFTDNLPAGVEVAAAPNASTTCTGGIVTAVAASGVVSYTGGTVTAGTSCTVQADVTGTATGVHVNTTGALTSNLGSSGTANDSLTVNLPPTFTKSFAPSSIGVGGTSTLTFTIDNTGSTLAANSLAFTDNLPAGTEVAATPNPSNTCGGTLSAVAGSGVVSLTGGTVGAGATCSVQVDVTATSMGAHVNTTGDLTSSAGNSGTATDTLDVGDQPAFSKLFAPDSIALSGTSTLTLTIDNTAGSLDATGLDFTDNLPAGVEVAATPNASTTCTGGTLTAVAGSGVVTYTGGAVTMGTSCTVQVDVTGTMVGSHVNTTGNLTSNLGTSGFASDTLTVNPAPTFGKAFAPTVIDVDGVTTLTFTIDNTASALDATGLDFTDNLPAGMLIATPANASQTCIGGTLTAVSGGAVVSYTGGTVPAAATCTIQVDVTVSVNGDIVNTTEILSSSLGSSGAATAPLTVGMLDIPTLQEWALVLLGLLLAAVGVRRLRWQ